MFFGFPKITPHQKIIWEHFMSCFGPGCIDNIKGADVDSLILIANVVIEVLKENEAIKTLEELGQSAMQASQMIKKK